MTQIRIEITEARPYVLSTYEKSGTGQIMLSPGGNLIDADLWERWMAHPNCSKAIEEYVESGAWRIEYGADALGRRLVAALDSTRGLTPNVIRLALEDETDLDVLENLLRGETRLDARAVIKERIAALGG